MGRFPSRLFRRLLRWLTRRLTRWYTWRLFCRLLCRLTCRLRCRLSWRTWCWLMSRCSRWLRGRLTWWLCRRSWYWLFWWLCTRLSWRYTSRLWCRWSHRLSVQHPIHEELKKNRELNRQERKRKTNDTNKHKQCVGNIKEEVISTYLVGWLVGSRDGCPVGNPLGCFDGWEDGSLKGYVI